MVYRILIVDDHEVVRLGLHTLLGGHEGSIGVGEASTGYDALGKAPQP